MDYWLAQFCSIFRRHNRPKIERFCLDFLSEKNRNKEGLANTDNHFDTTKAEPFPVNGSEVFLCGTAVNDWVEQSFHSKVLKMHPNSKFKQ